MLEMGARQQLSSSKTARICVVFSSDHVKISDIVFLEMKAQVL